jgi:Na+/proline symporter
MDHNITMANSSAIFFGWLDYSTFGLMLILSTIIGIYFGCFGTRQRTKNEYLLGNKKMGIFPIAMSLTASHISGITLLGAPSEMYTFGTQYWMMCLSACIVCVVVAVAYMPVFYTLQLVSTYEVRSCLIQSIP